MDYEKIGFKCGIEIHNRLATKRKLFCSCPARLTEKSKPDAVIFRKFRAVQGETGEVDVAASYVFEQDLDIYYYYYEDTCCLVEIDEEPPHEINKEALKVAIQVAKMLNCYIPDEIHVMRKTIIDGSCPSGFQRTAIVGLNGYIETSMGRVRIPTVCLEEESAGIVRKEGKKVIYRLDRLGIPLIEISTATDIKTPEHAREVAERLRMIVLSTGKSQRGIGSVRQDLNVSISGGARVEIKGVQELELIPKVLENEVRRQLEMIRNGVKPKEETRAAREDGSTVFLRPLPGSSRMYPETDIPPIRITPQFLSSIEIPESLEEREKRYEKIIGKELARQIVRSAYLDVFERYYKRVDAKLLARTLLITLKELKRDGVDVEKIDEREVVKAVELACNGVIAKESIEVVLRESAKRGTNVERVIDELNLRMLSDEEVRKIVEEVIREVKDKRRAIARIMSMYRGRVDARKIVELVNELIP